MKSVHSRNAVWMLVFGGGVCSALGAHAGVITDSHGNVGYDTAAECDAAVLGGTARFYQPFTQHPPLQRSEERSHKAMTLAQLSTARALGGAAEMSDYSKGACDVGVGHSGGRDGVSAALIGKFVPYAPDMSVTVYFDASNRAVRSTMQQCDNHFSAAFPRPVGVQVAAKNATECYASVQTPARFDTRTEQVVKVPASKRMEVVPATFKTITEQVLVQPEMKRQIPVPATYKTVSEEVVVKAASFREEPIPATYKTVTEQVLVKPASTRIEIIPATYKTVSEQVLVRPEVKELVAVPAQTSEQEQSVIDRPAMTRVETVPATFKTETEEVLVRAESLHYEPIVLPLRRVTDEVVRSQGGSRIETVQPSLRTVEERVLVKEATTRLEEVPAVFETVTKTVKVADATREWKRGRAWIGKAVDVRPLRGFLVGADGKVDGSRVDRVEYAAAAAAGAKPGVIDTGLVEANNQNLDDDVMCLVDVPERFETITTQVLKTAASVRKVEVPAQYATVSRTVVDQAGASRQVDIPATYQTVSRQVIDTDKLRELGYKFDDKGDIVATPKGARVLRAASLGANADAAKLASTHGASSGDEAYVVEVKVPAQYRTITRTVVDRSATVRTVEVPATYKTIKTTVVTKPASTTEKVSPAVYKTIQREVVDAPASQREIVIPAVYQTVSRQVVDTVASTRQIPVPEVRQTMTRRVVDTPASLREEVIPAVYRSESRKVVDVPASVREVEVPAQMETLSYQFKVAEGKVERRAVLCETNATPAKIREIQQALKAAGYNPGPLNGVLRAETMGAVNGYQRAKGLPVDGFLNLETVKALGVSPN